MNFIDKFRTSKEQAEKAIEGEAGTLRKEIAEAAKVWRGVGGTGAPAVQDTVSRLNQAKESYLKDIDKALSDAIMNIERELMLLSNR